VLPRTETLAVAHAATNDAAVPLMRIPDRPVLPLTAHGSGDGAWPPLRSEVHSQAKGGMPHPELLHACFAGRTPSPLAAAIGFIQARGLT